MKITKIAETFESLSVKSASGIQASGEIGLSTWMNGSSARYTSGDMPIRKPSGTATSAASPKPSSTRAMRIGELHADALVVRAAVVERIAQVLDQFAADVGGRRERRFRLRRPPARRRAWRTPSRPTCRTRLRQGREMPGADDDAEETQREHAGKEPQPHVTARLIAKLSTYSFGLHRVERAAHDAEALVGRLRRRQADFRHQACVASVARNTSRATFW